jgi:hypothetical protein
MVFDKMRASTSQDWFWHLTLNTGHTRKSHRSEVPDLSLQVLYRKGFLNPRANLPVPGDYHVETTIDDGGMVFTI